MSGRKWSEQQTMTFIELYASSEILWNTSLPSYKDKNARQLAYEQIVENMKIGGFGVQELKLKINNIRSAYCQELKKIAVLSKELDTSADPVYKPTVIWFKTLDSFLRPHINQRSSQLNLHCLKTDDEDEGKIEEVNQVEDNFKKRKLYQPSPEYVESSLCKLETFASGDITLEVENCFDIFGQSVAAQLKILPKRQAIETQLKLQTILTEQLLLYEDSYNDQIIN